MRLIASEIEEENHGRHINKIDPEVLGERPAGDSHGMSPLISGSYSSSLADRNVNLTVGQKHTKGTPAFPVIKANGDYAMKTTWVF